jgi:hypothetical protein
MPSGTPPDYYQVLQVDPRAEPEIIQAAYRGLAKKYHPDVYQGTNRGEQMRAVNEAYGVLGDPVRRAAYDQTRKAHTPSDMVSKTSAGAAPTPQSPSGGMAHPFPPSAEPRRYAANVSPFFTAPPPQAPFSQPSPPVPPALPLRPRLLPVLGGMLALVAFFLPWLEIQQAGLFQTTSFHAYAGADLVPVMGWLIVEPITALLLTGLGVGGAALSPSWQRWRLTNTLLGLCIVLLFLSQASSLLTTAVASSFASGPWLALVGFLAGLTDPFLSHLQRDRARQARGPAAPS